jgi:phage protein D
MTEIVTLRAESLKQGGFYIPEMELRVGEESPPQDVLRDVMQLTYKDNLQELDSFELTVNNWDDGAREFKYTGAETEDSLRNNPLHSLFEPCAKKVEVRMGYAGDLRLMLTGNFTTMEPSFTSSGAPTLTVRGLNVLHKLRRKQENRSWTEKKDSQIVKSLENDLPVEIRTHESALDAEPELPFLAQVNQYDIDFILSRARERGYVVFIEEDPENPDARQLYFGPSEEHMPPGLRDVTFVLEWGTSLIDFRPTLTTANQVQSVTVRGWNRDRRDPINVRVGLDDDDRRLNRNPDLRALLDKCDPREEVVVDEPIRDRGHARSIAISLLRENLSNRVTASGKTVGLPDLRAGKMVQIAGLGARFNGHYMLTETTHTLNDSGYTTSFKARREDQDQEESS